MVFKEMVSGSGGVQIATGSYVGTGTYGSDNPTVIECGFEPKFLVIQRSGRTYSNAPTVSFIWTGTKATDADVSVETYQAGIKLTGTDDGEQMNGATTVYDWFALG